MHDDDRIQQAMNATRTKSTKMISRPKSADAGASPHGATSAARKKKSRFTLLVILMSSGALAIAGVAYLLRSQLAYGGRYVGILVALVVIACGMFLIKQFIGLLEKEDRSQEEQLNANRLTVSPSRPDLVRQDTNRIAPAPEGSQKINEQNLDL